MAVRAGRRRVASVGAAILASRCGVGTIGQAVLSCRRGVTAIGMAILSGRRGVGAVGMTASAGRSGVGAIGVAAKANRHGEDAIGCAVCAGRSGVSTVGVTKRADRRCRPAGRLRAAPDRRRIARRRMDYAASRRVIRRLRGADRQRGPATQQQRPQGADDRAPAPEQAKAAPLALKQDKKRDSQDGGDAPPLAASRGFVFFALETIAGKRVARRPHELCRRLRVNIKISIGTHPRGKIRHLIALSRRPLSILASPQKH